MLSSRAYWLIASLSLTACELSPEGSGQVALNDGPSTTREAGFDPAPNEATSDAGNDEPTHDAANAPDEPGDATPGGTVDPTDGSVPSDGEQTAPDAGVSATGDTLFVSVGGEENVPWLYTSCDGQNWLRRMLSLPTGHPTTGEGGGLRGVAYGGGTFVVTGGGATSAGNARLLGRSVDGVTWQWEQRPLACSDCQWMGGAAFLDDGKQGVWIAAGGTGSRVFSTDGGRSWQASSTQGTSPYRRFRSEGSRAVGVGAGLLTIVDLAAPGASEPVTWRDSAQPIAHESAYIAAGNGVFVVVWYDDGCRYLRAGATSFRPCILPSGRDPVLTSVVFGGGKFSIIGHGAPIESSDGEHWTLAEEGDGDDFRDVTYAADTYATPHAYSSDAIHWEDADAPAEHATAIAAGRLGAGQSCPR